MSDIQKHDEIVCIDDIPGGGTVGNLYDYPEGYLEKGVVYTVEDIKEWVWIQDFKAVREDGVFLFRKQCFRKDDTEHTTSIPFRKDRFVLLDEYKGEIKSVH